MPLPLLCHRNGETRAGTGFLVKGAATGWLVTCAHLVTGLHDTPAKRSVFAGGLIEVLGTGRTVPLFEGSAQRFAVAESRTSGGLFDIVALNLHAREFAPLARFGFHDLAAIGTPAPGAELTATGYAGLGSELVPPTTMMAKVIEIAGPNLTLDGPSEPGMSGSPLLEGGRLVGMIYGDVGEAPVLTNALALSIEPLSSALFGD